MDSSPEMPLIASTITGDPTPIDGHPGIPTPKLISLRVFPVTLVITAVTAPSGYFLPSTQFSSILTPVTVNTVAGPCSAVVAPIVAESSHSQRGEAILKDKKLAQYPWLKSCRLIGYEKSCPLVQVLDGDIGRTGDAESKCAYGLREKCANSKGGRPRTAGSNSSKTSKQKSKTMRDGTAKKRGRPRKAGSDSDKTRRQQTGKAPRRKRIPKTSKPKSKTMRNRTVKQLGRPRKAGSSSDKPGFQQTVGKSIPRVSKLESKIAGDSMVNLLDSPSASAFDSHILECTTLDDVMDAEKGDGPHTEAYQTYIQKCREAFESGYNCDDPDNVRKMIKWLDEQALSYRRLWEEHRNGVSTEPSQLEEAAESECQPSGQVKRKRGRPATRDRKDGSKPVCKTSNTGVAPPTICYHEIHG